MVLVVPPAQHTRGESHEHQHVNTPAASRPGPCTASPKTDSRPRRAGHLRDLRSDHRREYRAGEHRAGDAREHVGPAVGLRRVRHSDGRGGPVRRPVRRPLRSAPHVPDRHGTDRHRRGARGGRGPGDRHRRHPYALGWPGDLRHWRRDAHANHARPHRHRRAQPAGARQVHRDMGHRPASRPGNRPADHRRDLGPRELRMDVLAHRGPRRGRGCHRARPAPRIEGARGPACSTGRDRSPPR